MAGTVTLVVWKEVGLGQMLYEIVPGFVANLMTVFLINCFLPQRDENVLSEFETFRQASNSVSR